MQSHQQMTHLHPNHLTTPGAKVTILTHPKKYTQLQEKAPGQKHSQSGSNLKEIPTPILINSANTHQNISKSPVPKLAPISLSTATITPYQHNSVSSSTHSPISAKHHIDSQMSQQQHPLQTQQLQNDGTYQNPSSFANANVSGSPDQDMQFPLISRNQDQKFKNAVNHNANATAATQDGSDGYQWFLFPDLRAIDFLRSQSSNMLMKDLHTIQLKGYESYIVEQWMSSRKLGSTICTYTGHDQDIITAYRVKVLSNESLWSSCFKYYITFLYHAGYSTPTKTKDGLIYITNLSHLPNVSLISIPKENITSKELFNKYVVSYNLRKMGCGTRSAMVISNPNKTVEDKFKQMYKIPMDVPLSFAVREIVCILQIFLYYFGLINPIYCDGLICNRTEDAILKWWKLYGTVDNNQLFKVKPSQNELLSPMSISSVIGFTLLIKDSLDFVGNNVVVPKDPLDIERLRLAIGQFQKHQNIYNHQQASKTDQSILNSSSTNPTNSSNDGFAITSILDSKTVHALMLTSLFSANYKPNNQNLKNEMNKVRKLLKNTMMDFTNGKTLTNLNISKSQADSSLSKEMSSILEINIQDLEQVIQFSKGRRMTYLWKGKGRAIDLDKYSLCGMIMHSIRSKKDHSHHSSNGHVQGNDVNQNRNVSNGNNLIGGDTLDSSAANDYDNNNNGYTNNTIGHHSASMPYSHFNDASDATAHSQNQFSSSSKRKTPEEQLFLLQSLEPTVSSLHTYGIQLEPVALSSSNGSGGSAGYSDDKSFYDANGSQYNPNNTAVENQYYYDGNGNSNKYIYSSSSIGDNATSQDITRKRSKSNRLIHMGSFEEDGGLLLSRTKSGRTINSHGDRNYTRNDKNDKASFFFNRLQRRNSIPMTNKEFNTDAISSVHSNVLKPKETHMEPNQSQNNTDIHSPTQLKNQPSSPDKDETQSRSQSQQQSQTQATGSCQCDPQAETQSKCQNNVICCQYPINKRVMHLRKTHSFSELESLLNYTNTNIISTSTTNRSVSPQEVDDAVNENTDANTDAMSSNVGSCPLSTNITPDCLASKYLSILSQYENGISQRANNYIRQVKDIQDKVDVQNVGVFRKVDMRYERVKNETGKVFKKQLELEDRIMNSERLNARLKYELRLLSTKSKDVESNLRQLFDFKIIHLQSQFDSCSQELSKAESMLKSKEIGPKQTEKCSEAELETIRECATQGQIGTVKETGKLDDKRNAKLVLSNPFKPQNIHEFILIIIAAALGLIKDIWFYLFPNFDNSRIRSSWRQIDKHDKVQTVYNQFFVRDHDSCPALANSDCASDSTSSSTGVGNSAHTPNVTTTRTRINAVK